MLQLIKHLQSCYNVRCCVLLPDTDYDGPKLRDKLDEINVEYFFTSVRFFKENNPCIKYQLICFKGYLEYLFRRRKEYKRFISYNFDIVHSNTSIIDIGAWLSRQLHAKHVWHLREFGDLDYNFYPLGTKIYERFTYRHADAYIAISDCVAKHFSNKVLKNRMYTIYNGVQLPHGIMLSGHRNEIINFVNAGALCEAKNQLEIVRAAKILVQDGIYNFHITLVGNCSSVYAKSIREFINQNELESYVTIMDETDGITELLMSMDVGITSSKFEAFGRTTIEYQIQNLLAIVSDTGANAELVEDGITGYVYRGGSPRSLAGKMRIAILDRSRTASLAEAGRGSALKRFTSDVNAKLIHELYKKLLE